MPFGQIKAFGEGEFVVGVETCMLNVRSMEVWA
jgi:hypothetical protein